MVTRSGATGFIFIKSNKAGVCVCVCVCVLRAEGGAVRIFSDEFEGEI